MLFQAIWLARGKGWQRLDSEDAQGYKMNEGAFAELLSRHLVYFLTLGVRTRT